MVQSYLIEGIDIVAYSFEVCLSLFGVIVYLDLQKHRLSLFTMISLLNKESRIVSIFPLTLIPT